MKTPREILLKRHQSAEARLDAIRERVVNEQAGTSLAPMQTSRSNGRGLLRRFARLLWLELIWSCRRAWCGLGAAWMLILTLNFFTADNPAGAKDNAAARFPSLLRILREQSRLAAELGETFPLPAVPEPSLLLGPRSDRRPSNSHTSHVFLGSARASRADCGASLQSCTCCLRHPVVGTAAETVGGAPTGTCEGACAPLAV